MNGKSNGRSGTYGQNLSDERQQLLQLNPDQRDEATIIAKFYKQKPLHFYGGNESSKANHWMIDMERIFQVLQCIDVQKILFTNDTLKGEALHW